MKLNGSIDIVGLSLLQPTLTIDTEEDVFFDHPKKYQWHDRPSYLLAYNTICSKQPNTVRLPHNLQLLIKASNCINNLFTCSIYKKLQKPRGPIFIF